MNISTNFDRSFKLEKHGLGEEDFSRLQTEPSDFRFGEFAVLSLGVEKLIDYGINVNFFVLHLEKDRIQIYNHFISIYNYLYFIIQQRAEAFAITYLLQTDFIMDDIFHYPDVDILPSKQVQKDFGQRVITVKNEPISEDMTSFYDKETFHYNSMFINLSSQQFLTSKSSIILNNPTHIEQNEQNKQQTIQDISNYNYNKSHSHHSHNKRNSNHGYENSNNIDSNNKDYQNEKDNDNDNGNCNEDGNERDSSDWGVNSHQITQINKEKPKDYDNFLSNINNQQITSKEESEQSKSIHQNQQIENSAISGANQVTIAQESFNISQNIQSNQKQVKINQTQFLFNKQQANEDEKDLQFDQEISSIKFDNNQNKDLQLLLNSYDEKEMCSQENLMKIQSIKKQLISLPYKRLIYRLKTQNCSKINLKFIVDPYGKHVKVKQSKVQEYLKLSKKKLSIESYSKNISWQLGESKILLEPLLVSATCYSCRMQRNGLVNNNYCSMICQNKECSKQIVIQFQQIVLFHQ